MSFKDEIKAADTKATANKGDSATTSDNDDIARLLRALNEDLKADPQVIAADGDDEEDEDAEVAAARHFPLGKIALALLAAGGIGVGVVMFDGSRTDTPALDQTAAVAPVGQGGASTSSLPLTLNPKPAGTAQPEALIARAPAPGPAPTVVPAAPVPAAAAPVPPIPAPPGRVEPAPVPPPVLSGAPSGTQTVVKPIEPPPVPKLDAPKPAPAKAPEPKVAEVKPAEIKPVEKAPEILKAPEPKAPEIKQAQAQPQAPEVTAPEVKAPEAKAPETNPAELQAMLSPPKSAQPSAKARKASKAAPAPAEPGAAPASRPAVSATGRWVVQAGSFSVLENAEAVQRKLTAKGYAAQVSDWTDSSQRAWKIVRVGGYDSQADAKRVAADVKSSLGLSAMVVSGR
ncbi:SPOR domain-containing protein [Azospirillum sp. sgz301742]